MQLKTIIILVLAMFLFGCVKEGVKVIKVTNNTNATPAPTSPPAVQPASNSTQSNASPAGTATGADLSISNFYLSTIHPLPDENFNATFKIANSGTESIKNFAYDITIKKGDELAKSEHYTYNLSLDPDALTSKMTKSFSLAKGEYVLTLKLDPLNAFQESNENNNVKTQSISVQFPTSSNSSVRNETSHTHNETSGNSSNSGSCSDTDNGLTYDAFGRCTDNLGSNVKDVCTDVNKLWEWSCVSDRCVPIEHTCECAEGKCVS